MFKSEVTYKLKTASQEDIFLHLRECDENFIPSLSQKVDLEVYSKKLSTAGVTFEAWNNSALIGLVAIYLNDFVSRVGFISNVSLHKDYMKKGIASNLMEACLHYAKEQKFESVRLEVNSLSVDAISLYMKFGFKSYSKNCENLLMQKTLN